jgi:hypothetical protein
LLDKYVKKGEKWLAEWVVELTVVLSALPADWVSYVSFWKVRHIIWMLLSRPVPLSIPLLHFLSRFCFSIVLSGCT